jgi:hypothetical protein
MAALHVSIKGTEASPSAYVHRFSVNLEGWIVREDRESYFNATVFVKEHKTKASGSLIHILLVILLLGMHLMYLPLLLLRFARRSASLLLKAEDIKVGSNIQGGVTIDLGHLHRIEVSSTLQLLMQDLAVFGKVFIPNLILRSWPLSGGRNGDTGAGGLTLDNINIEKSLVSS